MYSHRPGGTPLFASSMTYFINATWRHKHGQFFVFYSYRIRAPGRCGRNFLLATLWQLFLGTFLGETGIISFRLLWSEGFGDRGMWCEDVFTTTCLLQISHQLSRNLHELRRLAKDILKCFIVHANWCPLTKISLKFVPIVLVDNSSVSGEVHIMFWRWTGNKVLPQVIVTLCYDARRSKASLGRKFSYDCGKNCKSQ